EVPPKDSLSYGATSLVSDANIVEAGVKGETESRSKEEDTSVEDGNFPVTDGTHDVIITSEGQGKASPSHSTAPVCPKTEGNGSSKFPSVLNSVEDLKAVGDLGNTLLFSGMGVDSPKVVCSEGCSGAHEVLDVLSKRDFHALLQ
ncbi:hypothetical protein U1Q18_005264, partial [Sarracenia purpurea var. burkii]